MSDDKRQLLEKLRRARGRVRTLKADLIRLEGWQRRSQNTQLTEWIAAKRRVLHESEVFLVCVESLYAATE